MAWNDPVIWLLVMVVVFFLFGANRIPQFAKAIGQARKEFSDASNGGVSTTDSGPAQQYTIAPPPPPRPQYSQSVDNDDPLVLAAQKGGIDTRGKSRYEIAAELSLKLSKT